MSASVTPLATGSRRRGLPGSLGAPFLRHFVILVGSAALTFFLRVYLPVDEQPALWLAIGAAAGLLAGLIGGGWLGLLFVPLGAVLGVLLELHLRLGAGATALHELQSAGPTMLAAGGLMVLAYAGVRAALGLVRRSST